MAVEYVTRFIAKMIRAFKTEERGGQQRNQEEKIKKETQQIIDAMDMKFRGDLKRIELDEERKTKEFSDFLSSIDEMKTTILQMYPEMLRPLGLMFKHHASEVIKDAWENPNARERLKQQNNFMELMLAASSDLVEHKALPEKTLKLLRDLA